MDVTVRLNLEEIAEEINAVVGEEVETPESVAVWIRDNDSTIRLMVKESLVEEIAEGYEE